MFKSTKILLKLVVKQFQVHELTSWFLPKNEKLMIIKKNGPNKEAITALPKECIIQKM